MVQIRAGRVASLLAIAGGFVAFVACGSDAPRQCHVGADCASGACGADGICIPIDGSKSNTKGGADAGADGDAGNTAKDADTDAPVEGCVPNKDGLITADENPLAPGLHATYRIGTDESVSTAGTPRPDGKRDWDFSAELASDVGVRVETQEIAGKWYADKYPNASYVSKLSQNADSLGVFQTTSAGLLLLGVVSSTDGLTKTQLTHDPAVSVLNYPLKKGATWTTDADVSGYYNGLLYGPLAGTFYTEKYESSVDAEGTVKTPLGSFEVLRVKTLLTRTINLYTVKIRTMTFVTECYGTVATITSKDDESTEEFTNASEVRRIAP